MIDLYWNQLKDYWVKDNATELVLHIPIDVIVDWDRDKILERFEDVIVKWESGKAYKKVTCIKKQEQINKIKKSIMKKFKLITLLLVLLLLVIPKVKGQAFVEIFSNTVTSIYPVTNKICDSLGFIYVNHHIHREDPFTLQQSRNRHYNIGNGYIPETFINGIRVSDMTNPEAFAQLANQTMPYNDSIHIEGDAILQPNMNVLLTYDVTTDIIDGTLFMYIVEDIDEHPRVLRQMLDVQGTKLESHLLVTMEFDSDWESDSCYLIMTVENTQGKVITSTQMSLKESTTTSINPIPINKMELKIYPNPATNHINIEYEGSISSVEIYNIQRQIMTFEYNPSNMKIDVSDFPHGMYVLIINKNYSTMFIKN